MRQRVDFKTGFAIVASVIAIASTAIQGVWMIAVLQTQLESHIGEANQDRHETQDEKTRRIQREIDRALRPVELQLNRIEAKIDRMRTGPR